MYSSQSLALPSSVPRSKFTDAYNRWLPKARLVTRIESQTSLTAARLATGSCREDTGIRERGPCQKQRFLQG